ncbi:BatD family protein [Acidaminobacter sp. JC074]|uniref:BatD family protein n=1 Tax=Acidaminobacter sp. JC074 TaxID=2530199 RepID=UPI001F0D0EFE|nr:BatD family protein [Acidaminobacter sp. JC074]
MIGNNKKLKMALLYICIFTLMISSNYKVFAEEESVQLVIEDTDIDLGTVFNASINIYNMNGAEIKGVYGLDEFEVLNTSQSSNTSIINGKTTKSSSIGFSARPKNVGSYDIQALVEYKGKEYLSNVVTVVIREQDASLAEEERDVFIKTKVSKESLYSGETTVVTYELYTAKNVSEYGFTETPAFKGVISKQTDTDDLDRSLTTINGRQYLKFELMKVALTPTSTETVKIPAYDVVVLLDSGDFFSRGEQVYVSTDAIDIPVKELPLEGKPDDFSGLVGNLSVETQYDKDSVAYGEAVTLNVHLEGDMSLAGIAELAFPTNEAAVYQSEKDLKINIKSEAYSESKVLEAIIVPKAAGDLSIEPKGISYFNTETETYDVVELKSNTIKVTGQGPAISETDDAMHSGGGNVSNSVVISTIDPTSLQGYYLISKDKVQLLIYGLIVVVVVILMIILLRRQSKKDKLKADFTSKVKNAKSKEELNQILYDHVMYHYGFSMTAYCEDDIRKKIGDVLVADNVLKMYELIKEKTGTLKDVKKKILASINL